MWLTADDAKLSTGAGGLIQTRSKTIYAESRPPRTKVNRAAGVSCTLREDLSKQMPRPSHAGWFFPSPGGLRWDPDDSSADLGQANDDAGLRWHYLWATALSSAGGTTQLWSRKG